MVGFGAVAAAGVTGEQTYDMQAKIAIDTLKMALAPGDLFVGLLDTESSGGGFDAASLKFQDQLVGTMLDITFDFALSASVAGDGYGLSFLVFDPPGGGGGLPFDLDFTSLADANTYFADNQVFDLGPIPTAPPPTNSVPEPESLSIFCSGLLTLLGMGALRRHRKSKAKTASRARFIRWFVSEPWLLCASIDHLASRDSARSTSQQISCSDVPRRLWVHVLPWQARPSTSAVKGEAVLAKRLA